MRLFIYVWKENILDEGERFGIRRITVDKFSRWRIFVALLTGKLKQSMKVGKIQVP